MVSVKNWHFATLLTHYTIQTLTKLHNSHFSNTLSHIKRLPTRYTYTPHIDTFRWKETDMFKRGTGLTNTITYKNGKLLMSPGLIIKRCQILLLCSWLLCLRCHYHPHHQDCHLCHDFRSHHLDYENDWSMIILITWTISLLLRLSTILGGTDKIKSMLFLLFLSFNHKHLVFLHIFKK